MTPLMLPMLLVVFAGSYLTLAIADFDKASELSLIYAAVVFVVTVANLIRERRERNH